MTEAMNVKDFRSQISEELGKVKIGTCNNIQVLRTLDHHSKKITKIIYLEKVGRIAASSFDRTISILNPETGECDDFKDIYKDIWWLENFNDDYFLSCGDDRRVICWNVSTFREERSYENNSKHYLNSVLKLDPNHFVTLGYQCDLKLFDFETFEIKKNEMAFGSYLYLLKNEDHFIVTGGRDGEIELWNIKDFKKIHSFVDQWDEVSFRGSDEYLGFSSYICEHKEILITGGKNCEIKFWDLEERENWDSVKMRIKMKHEIKCLYVHKEKVLFCFTGDGVLSLIDLEGFHLIGSMKFHSHPILTITTLKKDSIFASGSEDGKIQIWRYENSLLKDNDQTLEDERERVQFLVKNMNGEHSSRSVQTLVKIVICSKVKYKMFEFLFM